MAEHTQVPRFDEGGWVKLARVAVGVSVALSLLTVAILIMADPPNQCPNWHLKNEHSSGLWEEVIMLTVPLNAFSCFIAVRWNWVVRTTIDREGKHGQTPFGHMAPPAIPVTFVLVPMCIMGAVASQF